MQETVEKNDLVVISGIHGRWVEVKDGLPPYGLNVVKAINGHMNVTDLASIWTWWFKPDNTNQGEVNGKTM